MDRIYKSVWDKVKTGGAVKRALFNFAVQYKTKWLARGGDTPIINSIVMSPIMKLLGKMLYFFPGLFFILFSHFACLSWFVGWAFGVAVLNWFFGVGVFR